MMMLKVIIKKKFVSDWIQIMKNWIDSNTIPRSSLNLSNFICGQK